MITLHPTLTPGVSVVHRDFSSQAGLAAISESPMELKAVA